MKLTPNPLTRAAFERTTLALALATLIGGCAALEEDKIDYKSATKAPSLEVPPDLSQLRRDSRYALESHSVTASGLQSANARVTDIGTATNAVGDVRMERQGNQRWLVVNRPADTVWQPLKEFWTRNGFTLVTDAPDVGILETDWAENRAKIPQDVIRRTLGKVFDSFYSSGERDKYRTRVERNAQGGVEIHITHRGMVENYTSPQKEQTVWQPRASDAELEIEFLRRLMVQLGASPQAATATSSTLAQTASVTLRDGQPTIAVNDTVDRAWRRVGVALDRTGFTVEDRDRSKGIYFVRYVASHATTEQQAGFLARLFSTPKETPVAFSRYQIVLTQDKESDSLLRVLNAAGQAESSVTAERILKLLASELQ